jgi:xanthine dehydrogenase YagS FAD-binding subunit
VAAGLDMRGDTVRDARIVLGGVAHRPWRASGSERALVGHPLDDSTLAAAAAAATEGAHPYRDNAFKVTLAQRAVARALREASRA